MSNKASWRTSPNIKSGVPPGVPLHKRQGVCHEDTHDQQAWRATAVSDTSTSLSSFLAIILYAYTCRSIVSSYEKDHEYWRWRAESRKYQNISKLIVSYYMQTIEEWQSSLWALSTQNALSWLQLVFLVSVFGLSRDHHNSLLHLCVLAFSPDLGRSRHGLSSCPNYPGLLNTKSDDKTEENQFQLSQLDGSQA